VPLVGLVVLTPRPKLLTLVLRTRNVTVENSPTGENPGFKCSATCHAQGIDDVLLSRVQRIRLLCSLTRNLSVGAILGICLLLSAVAEAGTAIQPWQENPSYWEYRGEPRLLAGGSVDDNLFQLPDLRAHLDSLANGGANYVRNTMSDRRDEGFEVSPFASRADGRYDLERWNPEYWNRFETFLRLTAERDIIVQIEVWDRFDFSRDAWLVQPYNPANNVNYTNRQSGFRSTYPEQAFHNKQPFFYTLPELHDNRTVLRYQKRFVDVLLAHTLKYDHVLYCVSNETSGAPEWSNYWANYIRGRATQAGRQIFITEMWDEWDITSEQHRRTLDRRDLYTYADLSQNNHMSGDRHWEQFQAVREFVTADPYPLNTVKTYGADGGPFGDSDDGLQRWWRHLLGGAAAVRFHRPDAGLGWSPPAVKSVQALRKVESRVRFWDLNPANHLLRDREPNEAFAAADPGRAYVTYFTNGGSVTLDLHNAKGQFELAWMHIRTGAWERERSVRAGRALEVRAPSADHWLAVLTRKAG
jgi:hypothetical protein